MPSMPGMEGLDPAMFLGAGGYGGPDPAMVEFQNKALSFISESVPVTMENNDNI